MISDESIELSAVGVESTGRTIAIDLDGTLLRTDSLVESLFKLISREPFSIFPLLFWMLQGKVVLKENVSRRVSLDVKSLPYNQSVIDWALEQRQSGARLILVTASHQTTAQSIADHLGSFDDVLASDASRNLKSEVKRDELIARFGDAGFEYIGNERADLAVWQAASKAHVVDPSPSFLRKIKRLAEVGQVFHSKTDPVRTFLRAVRVHQWVKNLLLFVPLVAAHQVFNAALVLDGAIAFVFFCMTSSSVYLLNDLLDLEDDRRHKTRKDRPLASGQLSQMIALVIIPVLAVAALAGSLLLLPAQFVVVLFVYYMLTLAYTIRLKRLVLVDVMTLAILYTLRILAGVAVFELVATFWMLAFSIFLFLSLAFVKRYTELFALRKNNTDQRAPGRGYYPDDFELLASFGSASGYVSVLVLALYIQDSMTHTLYSRPELMWLSCLLLLFWISRTWLIAHRGEMHDDPVVFALKDNVSRWVGLLFVLTFVAAI
jgi:4-hydroxybenzoate polyprenyltransferase